MKEREQWVYAEESLILPFGQLAVTVVPEGHNFLIEAACSSTNRGSLALMTQCLSLSILLT